MGCKPTILLADAGYFSYDNIDLLNQIGTDSYIPDNFFNLEERGKSKYFMKSMFRFDNENDCYYCPAGITMPFKYIHKRDDEPNLKQYIGDHCSICVLKNACTKAKKRIISRDPREHLMEDMRKRLRTVEGKKLYQERMSMVEPVFGQMKQNRGFTEFLLRGKNKTKVEFLIMCIVHNIEKIGEFLKRKAKEMKEVLRNGFSMDTPENIGNIMINSADKNHF
jgi:transposase